MNNLAQEEGDMIDLIAAIHGRQYLIAHVLLP